MQETNVLCCAVENLKLTPFTAGPHCKFHLFLSPVQDTFFSSSLYEVATLKKKKIKNLPSPIEIVSQ